MNRCVFFIVLFFTFNSLAQEEYMMSNIDHVYSTIQNKNSRGTVMLLRTLKETALEANAIASKCQKVLYRDIDNYCREGICKKHDAIVSVLIKRQYLTKINAIIQIHQDRLTGNWYNNANDLNDADSSMVPVYDWVENISSLANYLVSKGRDPLCN